MITYWSVSIAYKFIFIVCFKGIKHSPCRPEHKLISNYIISKNPYKQYQNRKIHIKTSKVEKNPHFFNA